MARRIDDDVAASRCAKMELRRIGGDVLLLFLRQRVQDEGVFELAARRFAIGAKRIIPWATIPSLPVATDQRRFPMIDMSDENDLKRDWRAETGKDAIFIFGILFASS